MILIQPRLMAILQNGGPAAVLASLHDALRLEFATVPLYLYSLYSLDRAKNGAIASILRSVVVVEEMLRMTLVCNIINALGDAPRIDDPAFAPAYPSALPGGIDADLVVHLEPFSPAQLDVFIRIEEPEAHIPFPTLALAAVAPPVTIGAFYRELKTQLAALGDAAYRDPPRNQIGPDVVDGSVVVTDVRTASDAINLIVEQGVGTALDPGEVVGGDIAHFYRFMDSPPIPLRMSVRPVDSHTLAPLGRGIIGDPGRRERAAARRRRHRSQPAGDAPATARSPSARPTASDAAPRTARAPVSAAVRMRA